MHSLAMKKEKGQKLLQFIGVVLLIFILGIGVFRPDVFPIISEPVIDLPQTSGYVDATHQAERKESGEVWAESSIEDVMIVFPNEEAYSRLVSEKRFDFELTDMRTVIINRFGAPSAVTGSLMHALATSKGTVCGTDIVAQGMLPIEGGAVGVAMSHKPLFSKPDRPVLQEPVVERDVLDYCDFFSAGGCGGSSVGTCVNTMIPGGSTTKYCYTGVCTATGWGTCFCMDANFPSSRPMPCVV